MSNQLGFLKEAQGVTIGTITLLDHEARAFRRLTKYQQQYVIADVLARQRACRKTGVLWDARIVPELLSDARHLSPKQVMDALQEQIAKRERQPAAWHSCLSAVVKAGGAAL